MSRLSHTLRRRSSIASAIPDSGYQFAAQEFRIDALIGLRQFDTAQRIIEDLLTRARETRRTVHEANALVLAADVAGARHDHKAALSKLEQATALGEAAGLTRLLAEVYS